MEGLHLRYDGPIPKQIAKTPSKTEIERVIRYYRRIMNNQRKLARGTKDYTKLNHYARRIFDLYQYKNCHFSA